MRGDEQTFRIRENNSDKSDANKYRVISEAKGKTADRVSSPPLRLIDFDILTFAMRDGIGGGRRKKRKGLV